MKTKIFCDIAELDQIKKFNRKKIVKGFTTNPSLMRKAGAKDYKSYAKKILKICDNKPVSLEVFADDYKEMKQQALQINTWGKNVYVKVPVANSKGIFMGKIIKELNNLNIKLNITAIYSAKQTEKILKLINKKTKVIISIFAGRAGDTGKDPVALGLFSQKDLLAAIEKAERRIKREKKEKEKAKLAREVSNIE